MAQGWNRVQLLGNLGARPELRHTQGGTAVLTMRIACDERWGDGDDQERTEWVQIVVWGKRAERLARVLDKGDRIFVFGRLQTRTYEQDGEQRYFTEVVCLDCRLLGSPRGSDRGEQNRGRRQTAGAPPPPPWEQ